MLSRSVPVLYLPNAILTLRQNTGHFEPTVVELKTKPRPSLPASRQQIADRLMKKGWKPEAFTDTGEPKVDETVLSSIDMPEARLLSEYLLLNKRIGQIATGKQAWLKMEKGGRIHGHVNRYGCCHIKVYAQ